MLGRPTRRPSTDRSQCRTSQSNTYVAPRLRLRRETGMTVVRASAKCGAGRKLRRQPLQRHVNPAAFEYETLRCAVTRPAPDTARRKQKNRLTAFAGDRQEERLGGKASTLGGPARKVNQRAKRNGPHPAPRHSALFAKHVSRNCRHPEVSVIRPAGVPLPPDAAAVRGACRSRRPPRRTAPSSAAT